MYANITLFFYMCKQIAKIFHIAGIYFSIFLHISKIILIFVVKTNINNHSHNFCFNGARRCETMGIFYCLIGAYTIDFVYYFNYDFVNIVYNIDNCR